MAINIYHEIDRLIKYGIKKEIIQESDIIYSRNLILRVLKLDDYTESILQEENLDSPNIILDRVLNWSFESGILENDSSVYRDLLDTEIMNCIIPRPSEIINKFVELYSENPKKATDYYYELSKSSNYIRMDRVSKNQVWKSETDYGDIDITINLSKPEKDPKAIAAAKNIVASSYPKCLLCKENEGYYGRVNYPARQSHRIIPISLRGEEWFLQYSPYVYYNEHSIIFKGAHVPMKISKKTFERVLEFVDKFPHYFSGSNADLPIVGGSILSHEHFQGGNYEFAMAKAPVEETFKIKGYENEDLGIVKWPMSVIRLRGDNRGRLSSIAEVILNKWKKYSDEVVDIIAYTDDVPHNTITPIARKRDGHFEIDLVLRNNRLSEKHPDGIFHPHSELHHIKKENIGLIEVMGLAVLPPRLKSELEKLAYYLVNRENEQELYKEEGLKKHLAWYLEILNKYDDITENNVMDILKREVGLKFTVVLEHAGVFKRDENGKNAFIRFIDSL
ncbi:UDP-glucose--hexose-1-phosphate uridylyltransferase [Clostridium sp.]|jgi:UDPglucose--hexose-1-phosphate uridylyltransferase|uniref:UDP-glucose--hexose-1-phosphate uridylyltransferase n=1 Tax=Clostridium sp. TaxID=1506 RepID=UPI003EEE31DE